MKSRQIFDDVIACDLWFRPPQSKVLATPLNRRLSGKLFWRPFFLENTCDCVLGPWPWPRAFLSLASRGSVLGKAVLGLGLGLGFFLCPWPWPWPRALCPRLHLWGQGLQNVSSRTPPLLINKHPYKTVECDFTLSINDAVLSRTDSVKYLGVYLDDKLNWIPHIKHLSLQLARCSRLFYRIRNLVPNHILLMLCYSLVRSRIQYGIILWGSTSFKLVLRELKVRLNNIVRTITGSRKFDHVTPLFKELKLLKLHDIHQLELGKFMYQLKWNKLPIIIRSLFTWFEDLL